MPFVGIPKTIDNDVVGTDASIGFNTAVAVAVEALDRLQPTAQSHHRVMVLEVMGSHAGHLALHAPVAGGPVSRRVLTRPRVVPRTRALLRVAIRGPRFIHKQN